MFKREEFAAAPSKLASTVIFLLVGLIMVSACDSACWLSPNPIEQELYHDDWSSEFGFRSGEGVMGAVLFDIPKKALIKTLRFYVWGEQESVRVYVLNSSQQSIYSRQLLFPGGQAGWFDVDISEENIFISRKFYVGWMWISSHQHRCPPCSWLGVDKDGVPWYRSYLGTIGNLVLTKDVREDHGIRQENYMIRVIVESDCGI